MLTGERKTRRMAARGLVALLLASMAAAPAGAQKAKGAAARYAQLDAYVAAAMKDWKVPGIALAQGNDGARAVVRTSRDAAASDAVFSLWAADRAGGPWSLLDAPPVTSAPAGAWVEVSFTDPRSVASRAETFYRIGVGLGAQP